MKTHKLKPKWPVYEMRRISNEPLQMFGKDVLLEDRKDFFEILSFLITSLVLQLLENIFERGVQQLYSFDEKVARFVTPSRTK